MNWLEALVLGIIQGLTEFLPVSSSGHLQIFSAVFGIQGEENLTFAVAVHAAEENAPRYQAAARQMEKLNRGLIAVKTSGAPN